MKEQIYLKSPRNGSQAEVMAEHPPLTEATKNREMEAKTPTPRAASQGRSMKRSATTLPKQHGKMSGNQKLVLAFFAMLVTLASLYAAYQLALQGQGTIAVITATGEPMVGNTGLFWLFRELSR